MSVLLIVSLSTARGGTAETPEISDPPSDCALPYGNAYLDATSAWIDGEDADSFDVHLRLAAWDATAAEGAGYAVQFTHQGKTWGVVAFYSALFEGGWIFWTGQATLDNTDGFEDASGAFDAATATVTITFDKGLFPHADATDHALSKFSVMTVDVRPAYPFILGQDAGTDADGHYVLCDAAASDAVYVFTTGGHSTEHAAHAPAEKETEKETADREPVAPAASTEQPKSETPFPSVGVLALAPALALTLRRRSRDPP